MSTTVFVMTHKAYEEPRDRVYRSLQVGRAGKNADRTLPYTGDDTGDNISDQNCFYGELTGLYWIHKNYHDDDYIGICHYRRFYVREDGSLFDEEDFERILTEYDIITSDQNVSMLSIREGYAESHNIDDLMYCGDAIGMISPDYSRAFEETLASHSCCYANLCVMPHPLFDEYCDWLFSVLFEASKRIDVSSYDNYHKRVYGFLSEVLLNVWIRAKGLRAYEARIGVMQEKAETKELKESLAGYIKNRDYTGGRKCYYDTMEVRPDVRLAGSDLSGEIPKLEMILYILEQEQAAGVKGFEGVSDDMGALLGHFDETVRILRALGDGKGTESDVSYLLNKNVSPIAAEVILRNVPGIKGDVVRQILMIK